MSHSARKGPVKVAGSVLPGAPAVTQRVCGRMKKPLFLPSATGPEESELAADAMGR